MYNFLHIVKKLKKSTLQVAKEALYKDLSPYLDDSQSRKKYLCHLNIFLSTYFLLKYKMDLSQLAQRMDREIDLITSSDEALSLGKQILYEYKDQFGQSPLPVNHQLIKDSLTFIQNHYHEKITLQIMANKLHISKNYLCHLFQQETGHKFCEYVSLVRVSEAKQLIEENEETFTDIAYLCGFSSQSHFSTTFKKYAGCTPKEYQKSLQ